MTEEQQLRKAARLSTARTAELLRRLVEQATAPCFRGTGYFPGAYGRTAVAAFIGAIDRPRPNGTDPRLECLGVVERFERLALEAGLDPIEAAAAAECRRGSDGFFPYF